MTLGEKIKQMRFKKDMTQDVLASRIGATKASISNYERDRRVPHYPVIAAMASVFEIPVDELLSCLDADAESVGKITVENQLDNIQARRVKKLTASFVRLSEEAQLKVIGYVEEISGIPEYQRTYSSVFMQYILNTYMLSYVPLHETEEQDVYEDTVSESKTYWVVERKHIILRNTPGKQEKQWHFLYYSCIKPIDNGSIVRQILKSTDYPDGTLDDLSFVFDDALTLYRFYACFSEMRENPPSLAGRHRTDYKFFMQSFLFILIDKTAREIQEVKILPSKGGTDTR